MTVNSSLEKRLSAVEEAISQLQKQVSTSRQMNWLEQVSGSFQDEPAFDEVLAYGRAIRQGNESILEEEDKL